MQVLARLFDYGEAGDDETPDRPAVRGLSQT